MDRIGVVIGVFALLVLMLVLTTWSGEDTQPTANHAVRELARSLPWVLGWLLAAFGFGRVLIAALLPGIASAGAIQFGLGIALMLWLNTLLGRLGFLQFGSGAGAWILPVTGWGIAILQAWRWWREKAEQQLALPHWMIWTAVPSVSVMITAALSAPGRLWRTEFGGYDVLSYHLQLPSEWLELGRIAPLEHNVYSFLPNFTEAGYYHLAVLIGDAVHASAACQLLHASFAVVTAWLIARFVSSFVGRLGGAVGAVVFLGTPWIVVTGSLAYNEMAVTLMLALGLCVLKETSNRQNVKTSRSLNHDDPPSTSARRIPSWRIGATIGVIAALACGAKLSALGFAAIPLGAAILMRMPWREWFPAIVAGTIAGLIVLSPWLVDNARASGNPIFPFLTSVFGSGHWSEEQVTAWNKGHFGPLTLGERAREGWRQFALYGIGTSPYRAGEPWLPQWSILPWLLVPGVAAMIAARRTRQWGVLLLVIFTLQLLFWLLATHVKSRFITPAAIPAAMVIGVSAGGVVALAKVSAAARLSRLAVAVALFVWCAVPMAIFQDEGGGAPAAQLGFARILTGDALSASERRMLGESMLPAVYVNHLLPENSRVLFVGEAAPFYYRGDFTYNTTWDRGPLSSIMREHEDDPAAWIEALHARQYTHVLVNPVMLDVWERAAWNDPLLTSSRVIDAMNENAQLIHAWRSGERLYRLD